LDQKIIWSFAVGTSTDCHSLISEYFHSLFCIKVQGSMLNKTKQSFSLMTFEPWLIIVIRQHVFHVHSSMMIFWIPITQIVQHQLTLFFFIYELVLWRYYCILVTHAYFWTSAKKII